MNTDPRNPDDPLAALFRAARENTGHLDRIEYGFETRTLARIREERGSSSLAWAVRLCPFAAALALMAGLWAWTHWEESPDGDSVADAVRLAGVPLLDYYLGSEQ